MDDRFDSLVRWLGTRRDRRGLATAGAGGVLGLLGLSAFGEDAAAKKCKKNKDCPKGKKCRNKKNGKGRCK